MPLNSANNGGMGEIVECMDNHLDRKVVVKKLLSEVDQRRIKDEYKALAQLRSKHVVQLYDLIEYDEAGARKSAIVLEYIDGRDLEIGKLSADSSFLETIWQIACGLRDIHDSNIIHRDIKPSNIRVDCEGVVKIIDFGLARSEDEAQTKNIIGTPVFMAPELWEEDTISFDSKIDVYSFGVTCIALLTSKPPKLLARRPPSRPPLIDVETIFVGLPTEISHMIYSCIAKCPEDRPEMNDVVRTLERELLKDRHRALVAMNQTEHWLHRGNRDIILKVETVGRIRIDYDGFDFKVGLAEGDVFLNNRALKSGDLVPGCCVITFGTGSTRRFVTFDVSHPEVSV
jgi:eukaryotic-like serine/threonine-protein kinase